LEKYSKQKPIKNNDNNLFIIGQAKFLRICNRARKKSVICLEPKDLSDFFSQDLGKALIIDLFIFFKVEVLYTPQLSTMLPKECGCSKKFMTRLI